MGLQLWSEGSYLSPCVLDGIVSDNQSEGESDMAGVIRLLGFIWAEAFRY